jgi:hypothetical protein
LLVARLAFDLPFAEAFEVDFLADGFAAADFELPFVFFEPERDFELLRLAVFFCVVWAILTLLSVESFRRAAYPRVAPVKPRENWRSANRPCRRVAALCRRGQRSQVRLMLQRQLHVAARDLCLARDPSRHA